MTNESECPGTKLEELVRYISFQNFRELTVGILSRRPPDFEHFELRYGCKKPRYDKEMISILYLERKREYNRREIILSDLKKYGKDWTAITAGLREHIADCSECFKAYVHFVKKAATEIMDAERGAFERNNIVSATIMPEDVLKQVDEEHLGLGIDFTEV